MKTDYFLIFMYPTITVKTDGSSPPILGVKRRSNAAWSVSHTAEKKAGRDVGDEFTLLGTLLSFLLLLQLLHLFRKVLHFRIYSPFLYAYFEDSFSGQLVEKRVRAISKRNPRLGLTVQKKISDCIFEASMELLEIDVSMI